MSYLIRTASGRNNIAYVSTLSSSSKVLTRTGTGRNNIAWQAAPSNAQHKIFRPANVSSSTKTFIDLDGRSRSLRYLDLDIGFIPTLISGMNYGQVKVIGMETWNIFVGVSNTAWIWFSPGNSSNGINWGTTHVYMPVYSGYSGEQYNVEVSGYSA